MRRPSVTSGLDNEAGGGGASSEVVTHPPIISAAAASSARPQRRIVVATGVASFVRGDDILKVKAKDGAGHEFRFVGDTGDLE